MRRFLEELIEGIHAGDEEAFLGAGEIARAHALGLEGTGVIEPYASLYAAEPITDIDAAVLKAALVEHLSKRDAPHVASAVRALGSFQDLALVPFLRELLANHLRLLLDQNGIVGNLIGALDHCGERVITVGGYGIACTEKSIADARLYLTRFGLTFPW
jgi:hypothetical protein